MEPHADTELVGVPGVMAFYRLAKWSFHGAIDVGAAGCGLPSAVATLPAEGLWQIYYIYSDMRLVNHSILIEVARRAASVWAI
jgi:hypothetical protein